MTSMQAPNHNNNNTNDFSKPPVDAPLEEEREDKADDPILRTATVSSASTSHSSFSSDLLMSEQLQENFRVLKQSRLRDEDNNNDTSISKGSTNSLENLAVETAILVQEELHRMKSSIAELEDLLQNGQDDDAPERDSYVDEKLRFPILPSIVTVNHQVFDDDDSCGSSLNKDLDNDSTTLAVTPPTPLG
jgi:hypothetical protein